MIQDGQHRPNSQRSNLSTIPHHLLAFGRGHFLSSEGEHEPVYIPSPNTILHLGATVILPKLCGRRRAIVFFSFPSFLFFFYKRLRSLGKTILVSPCEGVTLDGLPAGPGLPVVRLETTKRRRASAPRRHGSLGVDDPRLNQNKLIRV